MEGLLWFGTGPVPAGSEMVLANSGAIIKQLSAEGNEMLVFPRTGDAEAYPGGCQGCVFVPFRPDRNQAARLQLERQASVDSGEVGYPRAGATSPKELPGAVSI